MEDEKLNKILFTDIKIYFGYHLGIIIISSFFNKDFILVLIYGSIFCLMTHIFFRFISAIIFFANGNWEMGKARLLGIFVVLLIGVPICFAVSLGIIRSIK